MKQIALIFNCHYNSNYQLTMLGKTQAGYFIQLVLSWFNKTTMLDNLNDIVVFSTENANDLEPAMLIQNCTDENYVIMLQLIDRRWGNSGDKLPGNKSKAENLAIQINEFDRDCAVVFAYFGDDFNVLPFLKYWGMPKPDTWPDVNTPALVRIDLELKTIEFDFAPFRLPS